MRKFLVVVVCLVHCVLFGYCSDIARDSLFHVRGDVLVRCDANCEGVVVLPREIKHIGDGAFIGCRKITGVELHDSLETVGESAFYGCTVLREVIMPESVTNIGQSAFAVCMSLTNAVIMADINRIPAMLFDRCVMLQRVEFLSELSDVGESAFAKCRALKSVTLPGSVTNISNSAFFACSRLERFVSPEKLLNIGAMAFGKCYDLRYLVLSKHIETIGMDALKDDLFCNGIVIQGKTPSAAVGLLRDCSKQIRVYHVGSALQESITVNAEGSWAAEVPIVKCNTTEDAARACEAKRSSLSRDDFPGLIRVLRLAADGFSEQPDEGRVDQLKMDEFIAHISELAIGTPLGNVLEYVEKRSSTSASSSVRGEVFGVSAHFGVYKSSTVCVEMDLEDGVLKGIRMSTGLKKGVMLKLEAMGESPDEIDLRWLE